ncbi:acyl-CoA-binding domain-containing protein 7 isoform 2-T2 [Menidia menidia]
MADSHCNARTSPCLPDKYCIDQLCCYYNCSYPPRAELPASTKMSLEAEFKTVAEDVKKVKTRPSNDELLILYGLYKQALVGDINTDRPGGLDATGKAKWDAWDSRKGMSKDDAMSTYVKHAKEMIGKYGM